MVGGALLRLITSERDGRFNELLRIFAADDEFRDIDITGPLDELLV